MQRYRFVILSVLLVGLNLVPVLAEVPIITPEPLICMPSDGHAVVYADVDPIPAEGNEVRIFFRRDGYGDYYYVIMEVPDDDVPTRYRGVVPVPEPDNLASQLYMGVVGAGEELLSRSETLSFPIDDDCDVEVEDGHNFTVGETSAAQKGRKIAWWQCEDVSERIDVYGEHRDEGSCIPIIIWWQQPEVLIPLALGGIGTVVVIDNLLDDDPDPPVSPSIP